MISTDIPWWAWPPTLAGVLVALGVIWRYGVIAFGRAVWAAILAAPKIAAGVEELGELLRGDVLTRLEDGAVRFSALEERQAAHAEQLVLHQARLDAHEIAMAEWRRITPPPPPTVAI